MADKPTESTAAKAETAFASAPAAKPAAAKPAPATAAVKAKAKPAAVAPKAKAEPVARPEAATPPAPVAGTVTEQPEPAAKPVILSQEQPIAKTAAPAVDAAPKAEPAAAKPTAHRVSIKELKEKIMAAKPTIDAEKITDTVTAAFSDMQDKAKAAYEKGTATVTDMTEFAKGNVEAVVESGKILASGMQDMGKTVVDEAKSAYETATADFKEMAAVKSPTDLLQLQGKIARRNFDALMATGSRNSEMLLKLATDVFAPISGRVNLAVDKISKAA